MIENKDEGKKWPDHWKPFTESELYRECPSCKKDIAHYYMTKGFIPLERAAYVVQEERKVSDAHALKVGLRMLKRLEDVIPDRRIAIRSLATKIEKGEVKVDE